MAESVIGLRMARQEDNGRDVECCIGCEDQRYAIVMIGVYSVSPVCSPKRRSRLDTLYPLHYSLAIPRRRRIRIYLPSL